MVKLSLHKNIKRICVVLCLFSVLFPVCRIKAEELETRQTTAETTAETRAKKEKKKPAKIIVDYGLAQPWEGHPLSSLNKIYRDRGFAVFEYWLDIETFISPEMLSDRFGDFDRFYFYSEKNAELSEREFYTDAYVYVFETEDGGKYNISIHIEKLQSDGVVRYLPEATESITKEDVAPEDLRKADKPGTYWAGDIGYTYQYDKEHDAQYSSLSYFQWQSDGYAFFVDIDETAVEQYTLADGGFIAQMLREETAPKATEQFARELFPSHYQDEMDNKMMRWIILSMVAFFTVTVVATILLRRRKKKVATETVPSEGLSIKKEE